MTERDLDELDSQRKQIEAIRESFSSTISKLLGRTSSPLVLSMLGSLETLNNLLKYQLDLIDSQFDLITTELRKITDSLEELERETQTKRPFTRRKRLDN